MVLKTTLYLDRDTAARLRQLASGQGRSQAEVIRAAIGAYTQSVTAPRPSGIGKFHSGRADVSERAEELLFGRGRGR